MLRLTLKNLRANLGRLLATAIAVATGTAFLAAGLMITQSLSASVEGDAAIQYAGVDVAVLAPADPGEHRSGSLNAAVLEEVRSTEGVNSATGEFVAETTIADSNGTAVRSRSQGRAWIEDHTLNPITIDEGSPPTAAGEIVVDTETAQDGTLTVGDTVVINTPSGEMDAEIVGISSFGAAPSVDSGGTVFMSAGWAQEVLTGGHPGWQQILISSDTPDAVIAALDTSLPGSPEVLDSEDFLTRQTETTEEFLSILSPILTGFALLALFVSGFVIYNTFTVVVSQRSQELSLVRAIGGTPSQVRRSLLLEGSLLGLLASFAGLAAGMGIARLIEYVLDRFDVRLPGVGISINPRVILLTLFAGTLITLVSVMLPAWRAGSSRPVEAMRQAAVDDSGTSSLRMYVGGFFLISGIVLLSLNAFSASQWYFLGPGALLLFLGVVVGGPLLARLYGRLAGVLLRPSMTGRIAADNMVRNPKRTATTANALVIGLFLVTLVTVAGTALKDWIEMEIADLSESDFIVVSETAIPQGLVDEIAGADGVDATAPIRSAAITTTSGDSVLISGSDVEALQNTAGFSASTGSLDQVISGEGAADSGVGAFAGPGAGRDAEGPGPFDPEARQSDPGGTQSTSADETLSLIDPDGNTVEVPIVAQFELSLDTIFLATVVNDDLFTRLAGERPVVQVYVRSAPGEVENLGATLDSLTSGFTGVVVVPGNFVGQVVGQAIDFLIAAINGLLGLSVLIALIGIINTMNLSIHERRRELGMVRALGMTSSQVRSMVRIEGILIGLLGTIVGVTSGALVGWSVVKGITGDAVSLAWGRMGLIFAAGLVISLLACLLPARRAVKVPMLEAMAAS